jgi:hypothetical protein
VVFSPALLTNRHDQEFATYNSLFQSYPLLGSHSRPIFSDNITGLQVSSSLSSSLSFLSTFTSMSSSLPSSDLSSFALPPSSSSSSSYLHSSSTHPFHISTFPVPSLKPLKLVTAIKLLDPLKRICQYEVPGGGVCRDEGCDDVHLNRIAGPGTGGLEPSGMSWFF